jgi:hypothetical protein
MGGTVGLDSTRFRAGTTDLRCFAATDPGVCIAVIGM